MLSPSSRNPSSRRRTRQRGATVILFTFMVALVGIPLVGLAIDGSVAFWAKAKLSAAVDAAALASDRSFNMNQSMGGQTAAVKTVGNQWFWANFPNGWLGSTVLNGGPAVTPVTTASMQQQVTVTATASVPMYFMRIVGFPSVNISASAVASRRSSYVTLVLDRSGSMGPSGSNACPTMKTDAVNFVNMFTENFDTLSLLTYSSTANTSMDYGPDGGSFKSPMATAINQISCTGATSMAQALSVAYQNIKKNGLQGGLNVIVLFTDGQPNEVVADYPIMTSSDTRYGPYPPNYYACGQYQNQLCPDYQNSHAYSASTCNGGASIRGGFTLLTSPMPFQRLGATGGLFDTNTKVALNTSASILNIKNCGFSNTSYNTAELWARGDIAYIPSQDAYQDYTNAGFNGNAGYFGQSASAPETFTSGPYATHIRPDVQNTGILPAAINAADYQAQFIHSDSNGTYNVVIYTIGLGGAPDLPIDQVLLERIANDSRSPIYNSTYKTGFFAYASDPSQLNQAFMQIASQILRLTQ